MDRQEPWMEDRLGSLERGENPTLILRLKSGYAVLGDYQFLPGYCVLIASPRAGSLNELSLAKRAQFMQDMTLIGDAVNAVCKPLRLNYSVLMNAESFLHGHIQARYAREPDAYRTGPVWNYPREMRTDDRHYFAGEKYLTLKEQIKSALEARLKEIGYWEDSRNACKMRLGDRANAMITLP